MGSGAVRVQSVELNRWRGAVGWDVWPGRPVSGPAEPCNDAVLLDFRNLFFAVADGPARSPGSARQFLEGFAEILARETGENGALPAAPVGGGDDVQWLVGLGEEAIGEMSPGASCTFTGVWIRREAPGMTAVCIHTGDSSLWEWYPVPGSWRQRTRPNLWALGKSRRFYQAERFPLRPGGLLLLATDGFVDRSGLWRSDPAPLLGRLHGAGCLEEMPEVAFAGTDPVGDDAAAIFLAPERVRFGAQTVVANGPRSALQNTGG